MTGYAELHCLSNFTFLRGASHPEELVIQAARLGYAALALTDECSVGGVVRAFTAAADLPLQLIIGSEFCLADGLQLVLLATNRRGYGQLCRLISQARRAAPKGSYLLQRMDFEQGLEDCLVLWRPGQCPDLEAGRWLAACFPGRAWLAVELLVTGTDASRLQALLQVACQVSLPAVAAGDVHMHRRSRRALQDALTAIRLGRTLAEIGGQLHANGERHLRSLPELANIYPENLLQATLDIAARINFSLRELRYEYPCELVPGGLTPAAQLRRLTEAGAGRRWPQGMPAHVRRLIEHELALIAELAYEPYFLTVHDIVEFARSRGILCQGRGSAANSAVCFCLGITEVDPARMSMLMERFISRERNEPPDIDVDFEHERREEVIQYIYRKYGRDRAALAATVIRFCPRSAIRDLGKALGLGGLQIERMARSMQWWDGKEVDPERVREAGLDPATPVLQRLLVLVRQLVGFPRHLSQHVGGFVISQGPLAELVPLENAAMPERTVIQWDKDDLDALGLLKIDVLGLGMLTAIRRSLDLISAWRGQSFSLPDVPAEDPAVYDMICNADTMGVFQIESRAQMAMLPRLRPRNYYDLVIEVAIIRPGPIQGDMVHPYLRRRAGEEPVTYPSEEVRAVLERTLGVPIFQEQVMQLAVVAAGFTPGEADQLRRAMAAWRRRGDLGEFESRLINGMRQRGYQESFAQQIFNQIQGFGEYGFPESHAASFALLVYVSAWLKCHEPAAFVCALLNSQPMGFYAPSQLLQCAQRHGVEVLAVDVLSSDWDCTLCSGSAAAAAAVAGATTGAGGSAGQSRRSDKEKLAAGLTRTAPGTVPCLPFVDDHGSTIRRVGDAVDGRSERPSLRLGLRMVKGLSAAGGARLLACRARQQFSSVQDLCERAVLDSADLGALAAADALRGLAGNRHMARWTSAGVELPLPLLSGTAPAEGLPLLRRPEEGEDIAADYQRLGFSLRRHPLALLRRTLRQRQMRSIREVLECEDGTSVDAAGLVVTRQRPGSAAGVVFVTLEDETGYLNLIVWQKVVEQQRQVLLNARLLAVRGRVQRQGEVLHVVVGRLTDYSSLLGSLQVGSRDFH